MDFRIGPWLAKPDTNCLVSGCRECHVTPKSMDLLVCLARRQGGVTSKTEIFEEVWAGSFVSDDALVRCIGELRRTLGDNARTPAIIETIAKRGYRIVAPVVWDETPAGAADRASPEVPAIPAPPAGPARRWRSRWVGAGAAVVLAAAAAAFGWTRSCATHANSAASIRSIAVLPLRNASSDPEQEHFADGMTDALITRIAQIEALRVTSYTSVLRYKGTTASLKEVARALQVDGLIEGSVLRSGSRVRITTQLIRADSDTHLWSAAFEREMADVLSLQAEIARAVASQVSVKLGLAETARLTPARQVIPEAYEAYLKGMHFFAADQIAKAAAYFEESVRKDPGFAGAHAMLFEADSMMAFERDLPLGDRALRAMRAALELNPNLAEAHSDIGDVKFYWEWDWKAGETEFRKAVELDPRSVDAALHYAYCLHVLGRWDEALRECRRALALDPASRRTNQELFAILVSAHRDEQAIVQFAKTLELSPDNPGAYRRLGALHQRAGRDADALAAYLESQKQRQPGNAAAFEDAARSGGIRGLWKAWLALTLSTPEPVSPLNLAIAYLDAGEKDQSLAMLERSFSRRAPRMAWLKTDPAWDGLRSDPRFQSLLRRMNLAE